MIETLMGHAKIRSSSRHIERSPPEAHFQFVAVLLYFEKSFHKKVEDAKLQSIRFRKSQGENQMDTNNVEREVSLDGGIHQYRTSLGDSNTCCPWGNDLVHMVLHICNS